MSQPLLEVRNLHTYLNANNQVVKAVDDISFTIPKGETFCLVGESGSGKSICALSIIRLLPQGIASHPKGEILFNNKDILQLDDQQIRSIRGAQIAMIFQEPMTSLNPVLTIGDQISEALLLHHPNMSNEEADALTMEALAQVQLPTTTAQLNTYPHQMSGGQRQRVMIAMALACKPQLLIADEPTTALDVTVQAEILRLMRKLQDDTGMSILFITHDFGVVAEMAQWVGVMQHGKLVEVGNCQDVLRRPQHSYSQKLLAAVPENMIRPTPTTPKPKEFKKSIEQNQLLQVRNLKVWFPVRKGLFRRIADYIRAVDDVSLDITKGQIIALVGESGCGKTTLGRAILQLEQPTSGSVKIDGAELTGLSASDLRPLRRKMQIAFQDPQSSLNPRLLIETTLTEPMKAHKIGKNYDERIELAAQALENVQLKREFLWRYPHEFSGGQRQRIGLARALALNPEFIVCDEITSALDVSVQAEILQLLLKIREQRQLTLLFITHNIGVVKYISDQTVVMYQGKVVEKGPTSQVCYQPQHPYTQKLLAAVPKLL